MSTTIGADTARDALADSHESLALTLEPHCSLADYDGYIDGCGCGADVGQSDWSDHVADVALAAGWRPPAPVITGDVPTVTAALDALPAGTVIRIVEEEDGPQVFEAVAAHGHYAPPIVWSSTRSPRLVDSGYIARGETPVTVLWAGETA